MKTGTKRLLSALLAVCMCIVVLPETMTAVDAVSPGYTVSSAYKSSSYYSALSKVTLTGNQREDIVNVALSQVGYREGSYSGDYGGADDGSYNNYTEYNYWYHNYVSSGMPVGGSSAPWCATFVSWCAEQAGVPASILKRSTAAGHGASYFNINFYSGSSTLASSGDNDAYFKGYNYTPKKGDLFYTRSWSHVGLVVSVNGVYVTTVEGNTNNNGSSEGNGVYLRTTRKITDLYFGVPNYVVGTHTCDKGTYAFYEADHPHYKCYKCSMCGQVWRNTAEPTIVNTCTSCIPQKPTVSTAKSAYAAGSSVQISWNAVTGNEYYWINVYKDGTLIVNQSMANNSSYTLQSVGIGSYWVNLSANNSAGTSGSASCSFSVVEDIRPDAPNIRASAPYVRIGSSITVSWDPVKNATSYAYYVTEYPTIYVYDNSFKKGTTTETSVTFTDLPNGKYLILVVALNALGTHSWESNYLWMEFYNYDYTPTETAFLDGHMYTCRLCGDCYKDRYTDALRHSYSDGTCIRCGAEDPDYVVDVNAPQVVLDSKAVSKGSTVCVDLKVLNNPGFSVLNVAFRYDNRYLSLTSVENKATSMVLTHNASILWDSATNYTADGVLATLNFAVAENAPEGDYEIRVVFMGASNEDFEEVKMVGVSGVLTVTSVVYGDANGDGQVTTVDLAMLRKYLSSMDPISGTSSVVVKAGADCNGDGKVNTIDLAMLRKYLSSKDPITGESSVVMGPK